MCYSAQVIQMARKLHRQLGIRIDYDEVERLFFRRLDDPSLNISRGFEANFDDPTTDQERRIKGAIDEHAWLTPQGRSSAELQWLLSERAIPVFQHEVLKAA